MAAPPNPCAMAAGAFALFAAAAPSRPVLHGFRELALRAGREKEDVSGPRENWAESHAFLSERARERARRQIIRVFQRRPLLQTPESCFISLLTCNNFSVTTRAHPMPPTSRVAKNTNVSHPLSFATDRLRCPNGKERGMQRKFRANIYFSLVSNSEVKRPTAS